MLLTLSIINYGKLNFSVAFNPTSAFPLDARTYFTSLEEATAAAATAAEVGSKDTVYYYGQKIVVLENGNASWYKITPAKTLQKIYDLTPITQADYDALVEAGAVDENAIYVVVEGGEG